MGATVVSVQLVGRQVARQAVPGFEPLGDGRHDRVHAQQGHAAQDVRQHRTRQVHAAG